MNKEKWQQVLGNILDNFEILEHENEHFDEEGGVDVESVVFLSPAGKIRLEHIEKPIVLGKKTNYSHRAGQETAVEYQYSETERSSRLVAYRWSDGDNDWLEIDAEKFS